LKAKITLILFLLSLPAFSLSFNDPGDPADLAYRITAQMTDEQALAQTLMLAWVGAEPSPLILQWIRQRNIGGVKIFGWNTDNTRILAQAVGTLQTNALANEFGIPLLVATDQEGGMVRHVRGDTSITPGNMAIGASGRPRDAFLSGYYIGREMALLGINMNFAPTIDLYTNRDSTLIGPRAFSPDPLASGILGSAFARGHREWGVIPTAKHFPGHGDTPLDSHGVLPRIYAPLEVLWERELLPFRFMIHEGVPAIMSAHLAFPNTPGGSTPASLSRWFMHDLLREKMGFDGLIITDDLMMMGALAYTQSLSRAARLALEAGNDIVMLSITPFLNDVIWTYLLSTMRNEPEFRERVRDACRRVIRLKLEHLRGENKVPFVPDMAIVDAGIIDPEGSAFFLSLAARGTTIIDNNDVFPLTPANSGRVLLAGNFTEFFTAGSRAFPNAAWFRYSSIADGDELVTRAMNADTVIVSLSNRIGLNMLQRLRHLGRRVIVFSVLNPGYLYEVPWVDGAVAVYSFAPVSFTAGFSAILGRISGAGTLPFTLIGHPGN